MIFGESGSHADDIIKIVDEEFGEEIKFYKKITYRNAGSQDNQEPRTVLQQFRRKYFPCIAVKVDVPHINLKILSDI